MNDDAARAVGSRGKYLFSYSPFLQAFCLRQGTET